MNPWSAAAGALFCAVVILGVADWAYNTAGPRFWAWWGRRR